MYQIQKSEGIHRSAGKVDQQGEVDNIPGHDHSEKILTDLGPFLLEEMEIQVAAGLEEDDDQQDRGRDTYLKKETYCGDKQ